MSIDHIKTPTTIEALTYQNDAAGNRVKVTRANAAATLIPQAVTNTAFDAANEQTRFNSASTNLVYDNNGNLTSFTDASGTTAYTWNARNRLTGISGPSLSASFVYDGLGRRSSKTINSATTGFWYDGEDLLAELSGSTPTATYVRSLSIDEPFIRKQSGGDEYYQTDALGTTVALTDGSGASSTTYTQEPFGKTTKTGSSTNAFQYTGREEDGTGVMYYRARFYSSKIQRFLGEDPLEFDSGETNLYGYVANNPINLIDPTGLTWETNATFFWQWSTGLHNKDVRNYRSYDVETVEMSESPGAEKMRQAFKLNGCKTKGGINYGTFEAAWDTLLNPLTLDWSSTAFQVGGFAGASVVDNKNGTVTCRIRNVAGTHSFFYHLVADRKGKTGPMRNVEQNFSWTEPNPCSLSGRK
ncbi:MAG: RHS repeat-associated core domain-containing protein [Nitrospiraceae bacterium]